MAGPRPKPPALRELLGNAGHRAKPKQKAPPALPLNAAADLPGLQNPEATPTATKPPEFLNAAARRVWAIVAPPLQRLNFLAAADVVAFGRYCGWLAEYEALTKSTRRRKIVESTAKKAGKMDRLDKAFQARLMLDKRLQEYEDRFGMNPQARQAILARLADGGLRRPATPPPEDKPPASAPTEPTGPIGLLRAGSARLQ